MRTFVYTVFVENQSSAECVLKKKVSIVKHFKWRMPLQTILNKYICWLHVLFIIQLAWARWNVQNAREIILKAKEKYEIL